MRDIFSSDYPMNSTHAFSGIPVASRPPKPRESGLTMLIDWGIGPLVEEDLLKTSGEYIDLAKIAVGIAGLLEKETLATKLQLYRDHAVKPFPGGQFLEYAVGKGLEDTFLKEAGEAGFQMIEVSDNTVPFEPAFKTALIRKAREEYGFTVLGEVGSKIAATEIEPFVADVRQCLDAGAWKVFVEAADLLDGEDLRVDLVEALNNEFKLEQLIFELPGWWIGSGGGLKVDILNRLFKELGPEVNLANVEQGDVMFLETQRRKTGVSGF